MGITLQWVSVTQSNLCGTFKREKKYNIFLLQSKGSKVREYLCGLLCSADMHCGKRDDVDEVPEKENLKTMQLVKYYDIFFIKVLYCFLTIYFYKLKKKSLRLLTFYTLYVCFTYMFDVCVCVQICVYVQCAYGSIRVCLCACLFVCVVERYLKEV